MVFELIIEKVDNGYRLYNRNTVEEGGKIDAVIQEKDNIHDEDEVESTQELLYAIIEYFGIGGSKHDAKRINISIEEGSKYVGVDN